MGRNTAGSPRALTRRLWLGGDIRRVRARRPLGTVMGGGAAATVVWLSGRCDSTTAGAVRDRLHAAVRSGPDPLVVDMSNVDTLDAVGLGVLVGTQRLAAECGRRLLLRGTPERLAQLLRVIGLNRVLPTVPPQPAVRPGPARPPAA